MFETTIILILIALLFSCGTSNIYNGVQGAARQRCYEQHLSTKDKNDCLKESSQSYEEYQRERNKK